MNFRKVLSKLCDWVDSPETGYLYALPILGGIKSHRLRKQARVLSHATDGLDEISYRKHYKLRSIIIPIVFELVKIGTLAVTAHGILKLNPYEVVLGGVGYGFGCKIESDIMPKIYGLK